MVKALSAMVQNAEHHHLINYKMTFGKTATIFTWCILYLTAIFKMNALYHGI